MSEKKCWVIVEEHEFEGFYGYEVGSQISYICETKEVAEARLSQLKKLIPDILAREDGLLEIDYRIEERNFLTSS